MKKKDLLAYLRDRRRAAAALTGFLLLFWVVYAVYQLPSGVFGYGALLVLTVGLLLGVWDFFRFVRKRRALSNLKETVDVCSGSLPPPDTSAEAAYQELLKLLLEENAALRRQRDNARTEQADYYSLWVHQIKTPIAAMRLLLQSGAEPAALEQELFKTEQYAEMALTYARLPGMSQDLLLREIELSALVRRAVRKYAVLFLRREISLELADFRCTVVTDEKWLGFVLEQLLSNALKYTREGRITIRLSPDGSQTLLIEDTGIGIRPEDVPRVFDRGFTGCNGRADRRSTGLGLYLSKQILDALGHGICIVSQPGKGTTVALSFSQERPRE
ncbi:MAG: sensor histidine kinase [Candidatus Merdivicinus sp.]|jgi:signal transduction histidine kinase